jgi:patatin-like phospholipase/acyl hydrolase
MVELFDLIAGSESGAILASTLAIKNENSNSS